jgi:DNA-binding NtrC family response regulator
MPGMSGLELQKKITEINPDSTIVIITAYASVESAVEAMQSGAYDYLSKPFDPDYLGLMVRNIIERKKLKEETVSLKKTIEDVYTSKEIIGESPGIKKMLEDIRAVADTGSTVLIRGESGTGKELVARAIHANSKRRYAPIVTINCGALPESILESELFGHEKGAFTGAQYARKGKFEMADGGTIFLDEIGNISPKIQMELLRVLEDKKFFRLGGSKEIKADFRTIAATNQDLEAAMAKGAFRDDLFYRLNVFVIEIPPLRSRRDDIPLLADHFLKIYSSQMNKPITKISPTAMKLLIDYDWPGNVRELENAIERAIVICKSAEIQPDDFPFPQTQRKEEQPTDDSLEALQRQHIKKILDQTGWNISKAAIALQIDRVTLYNKINKYNLKKP